MHHSEMRWIVRLQIGVSSLDFVIRDQLQWEVGLKPPTSSVVGKYYAIIGWDGLS